MMKLRNKQCAMWILLWVCAINAVPMNASQPSERYCSRVYKSDTEASIQGLVAYKFPSRFVQKIYGEQKTTNLEVEKFCDQIENKKHENQWDKIHTIDLEGQKELTFSSIEKMAKSKALKRVSIINLCGTTSNLQSLKTLEEILKSKYLGSVRDLRQVSSRFCISSSEIRVLLDKEMLKKLREELKENPIEIEHHKENDPGVSTEVRDIDKLYQFGFNIEYKIKHEKPRRGVKWVLVEGV